MGILKPLLEFDPGSLHVHWAVFRDQQVLTGAAVAVAAVYALYKVFTFVLGVYRRSFHPLSKFPGHPEACISTAWAYREAANGFAEETFERLHKEYGTKALRVGPNELHISDVELYKSIYKQVDPFPKYEPFYKSFNAPHTLFSETDPAKHKERRRLLNPMFSRAGILKLEPLIREKLYLLDRKIERLCRQNEINVYDALRLLTTEIIMQFAFARSAEMIEENENDFGAGFTQALSAATHGVYLMYEKPWIRHMGNIIPTSILGFLNPSMGNLMSLIKFSETSVQHWKTTQPDQKETYPVVFDRLAGLPESEKTTEATDLLIAGSDTTASSAATAIMQILTHPQIERKLVDSLDAAIPSADNLPPLLDLEKIEYLKRETMMILWNADFWGFLPDRVCEKSLRFTSAAPGRLPRVVPDNGEPFVVDGQVVPPGTIVSMSPYQVHNNVGVWGPDARSFNPDRWLVPEAKSLEQYQVAFSKGSRMCIGQNLATAEITIILAHFFRRYKMTLPADFVPPRKVDVFTLEYEKPGIPVQVSIRQ